MQKKKWKKEGRGEAGGELLEKARTGMEARGLKETTISRVLGAFRQFIETVGLRPRYGRDDVVEFLAAKTRVGCSGTTVHNYYRFIKIVFDRMGWPWELTTKDLPRKGTPYQPYFTLEDTAKLEGAAGRVVKAVGRYGKILRLRNRALIRLSAVTMLRRVEIIHLDVEDYARPFLKVRHPAKQSEYTLRILDPETSDTLDAYIEARKRVKSPALFIRGRGRHAKRLSLRGLSDVIKRIREEAGIEKPQAGWHAHRRGGLTVAHKGGSSEKQLSEYTGITPEIVRRYIQLDQSEAIQAFTESHPFFKNHKEKDALSRFREILNRLDPEARKKLIEEVLTR